MAGAGEVLVVGEEVMDDDGADSMSGASRGVSVSRGSVRGEDGGSTIVDDIVEVSRLEGDGYWSANLTVFLQLGSVEGGVALDAGDSVSSTSSSWKWTFFLGGMASVIVMMSVGPRSWAGKRLVEK
jgi:hypothetical protein